MAPRTRLFPFSSGGEACGKSKGPVTRFIPRYTGFQQCTDETHPGPPYRTGGPLSISKKLVYLGRSASIYTAINPTTVPPSVYSGYFAAEPYFPPVVPSASSLAGWGAIGWNRTYPLHPVYSMGVSIFELKDLHGMVSHTMQTMKDLAKRGFSLSATRRTFGQFLSDLKKGPKYMADNYLNTTFGWIPFFQDLAAAINYHDKLLAKLRWLRNHNGRSVRRRVTLDSGGFSEAVSTSSVQQLTSMVPVFSDAATYTAANTIRPRDIIKAYDSKTWFVAKYRFYIPELAHGALFLDKHRRLASSLYGLDLDPSIIYKVIPWSWLLDWFLNVGAVLQNIYFRARFHVVAEYAYVMCSEKYTYIHNGWASIHTGTRKNVGGSLVWDGPDTIVSGSTKTQYIFRQREVANPYGFGITFKSLSAYQWSILAALGLSRRGKSSAPRA